MNGRLAFSFRRISKSYKFGKEILYILGLNNDNQKTIVISIRKFTFFKMSESVVL